MSKNRSLPFESAQGLFYFCNYLTERTLIKKIRMIFALKELKRFFIIITFLMLSSSKAQQPNTFLEKNDTLKHSLKKHIEAIKMDAIWQKILTQKNLYQEMQQDVHKQDLTNIKRRVTDEVLKERLALLNEKTPISISYNENLASVINYYLSKDDAYFQRIFSLGDFYFPMFESKLIQRSVPLELKYLAIVESALNPQAKSSAGAVGLWQFMYQTGKAYGLEVNSYRDERMQPEQATKAAAAYLEDLHQIFDDWNLAIAAYNSGPGNVSKAIRRSAGSTNFWNIRYFLPRETAGYVPSFQAIMYIFEYADKHQISYRKPPVFRYATDTIHIKKSIQLSKLADILSIDHQVLKYLNPSYYKDIVPYRSDKEQYIRLPIETAGQFVSNEEKMYDYAQIKEKHEKRESKNQPIVYRVQSGDYLGRIAEKFGVRIYQLKRWNNLRSSKLAIGQRLVIHSDKSNESSTSKSEYIVKSGDSLWLIAKKFPGVSVKDLKKINNLASESLQPGMRLKIKS